MADAQNPIPSPFELGFESNKQISAGPSLAGQSGTSGMFDSSNWTINFSGSQTATSTSAQKASSGQAGAAGFNWWIAAAVVAAGVLLYKRFK